MKAGVPTALCAVFLAFVPAPALAALHVCNQTSYVLYTAVGWKAGSDNITQGWSRIVPGECAAPYAGDLRAPAYYLYARTSQAHTGLARAWGGTVQLCAKDANFNLKTPSAAATCQSDDAFLMPYSQLDTHAMKSWTTTLTESGSIASLDAARNAGLERLLNDNGYKSVIGGTTANKARDEALKRFRAKMKLQANASTADLFDALETEAMKGAAPAGYSICNDTDGVVWAAIGLAGGKDSASAGWWKVPSGGCARALTLPLKIDRIFLHAEKHNKPALVSGPARFCVANITFQVAGTKSCGARGLAEAGFAVTNTKGVSGYAAHIGNDGLVPQQPAPLKH